MIKQKLLNTICLGSLILLSGCNSGGDASYDNYNPQPINSNAVNYFSNYNVLGSNEYNNIIFQVQNSESGIPNSLALFQLSTYNTASTNSSALAVYPLLQSGNSNNYLIYNKSGSQIGNLVQESNNNVIIQSSFNFSNGKGARGETSTILIATTQQQLIASNSYIGHCFNLPTLFGLSSNYGNDVCSFNIGNDYSFSITDLAVNNSNLVSANLCSSGTWNQSIVNPFFYSLTCNGVNGKTVTMQATFTNYNNVLLMNLQIPSSISSDVGTLIVSSAIPSQNLNSFTSTNLNLKQLSLQGAGNVDYYPVVLSPNTLVSPVCATFGDITGICPLSAYSNQNIPLGVMNLNTPTSTSSYPQLIGSSSFNLFVDNNLYSYYVN